MTVFFLPPFFFTKAASTTDPKLSILDDEGRLLPGGPLKCAKSMRAPGSLAMLYYALTHLEEPPSEGAGGAGRLLVVLVGVEQVRDRNG